ncbi:MAG: DUF262 domain-containing protein [Selenomonadaceae bacterium]|nr:DUF262 domain-containing protein [Selenomonadaceae bacterium]
MAILKLQEVGKIEGNFVVPDYQRGYRWTEKEVTRLLDDVYNLVDKDKKYCLQPIVVKNLGDKFEVIDGQQRLTTLFLIYNFMYKNGGGFIEPPKFSLSYDTREKSAAFLADIDFSQREDNIDFWFIANACETIENWFNDKGAKAVVMPNVVKLFTKNIQIIWYEVDGAEDGAALFTRLNIGKIPLTNAELVKAMFLSRSNPNIDERRQQEIALHWDTMEKELHDDSLWFFLTNNSPEEYQTRVDLILDLIAEKNSDDRGEYATFVKFEEKRAEDGFDEVWTDIRKTFLLLKDWHEDHEFYHKIGYLIASEYKNLAEIYAASKGKTTSAFLKQLEDFIRESIRLAEGESYSDWTYENQREKIRRLLLLFNVESIQKNSRQAYWFPFDKFKFVDEQNARWSLEHIHAVHSQRKGTQKNWREWLLLHKKSLESLAEPDAALIAEIDKILNLAEISYDKFEALQKDILQKFPAESGADEYIDTIANLALIKCAENSALGNSTFDVKRNAVIEMDMRGEFIPLCTRLAFLKYYTKSEKNQLHFWSQVDRDAYIAAINETLSKYLAAKI